MEYNEQNKQLAEAFFNELFKIGQGLNATSKPYEIMKSYVVLQEYLETLLNTVYLNGVRNGVEAGKQIQMTIKKN